eukprot:Gb_22566 [translate_table: standard]
MGDVKLPKFVAFKCDNGKYVSYANTTLDVGEEDIQSPQARHEVVPTTDGNIMLKCAYMPGETKEYFWYLTTNGWLVSFPYKASDHDKFIFKPVAVDSKTIGLKAVANTKFCKPSLETSTEYFRAISGALVTSARLIVAEPVLKRRLYSVNYDLDNAQIYDWQTIALGTRKATNSSPYYDDVAVSLAYTQTKSRSWNASLTVGVGVEVTVEAGIPLVEESSVTVSAQVSTTVEMGKTVQESTTLTDTFTVKDLPPGGTVVVRLTATQAKCNVPFTYTREDTFSNGDVVTTQLSDGVFKGVNYSFVEWHTT